MNVAPVSAIVFVGEIAKVLNTKITIMTEAKQTAEIFRKHDLHVRVVNRKNNDSYVGIYTKYNEKVHGYVNWVNVAHKAMQEAIESGLHTDVYFREDPSFDSNGKRIIDKYNVTGKSNNLRLRVKRSMLEENA